MVVYLWTAEDVSKIKKERGATGSDLLTEWYSIQSASCADIWSGVCTYGLGLAPHLLQGSPCVGQPWVLHVECIIPGGGAAFVLCVKALYWSQGEMEGPLIKLKHSWGITHKCRTYLLTRASEFYAELVFSLQTDFIYTCLNSDLQ